MQTNAHILVLCVYTHISIIFRRYALTSDYSDIEEQEHEQEQEQEEEESLFKAGAVNEEDSERDRATQEEGDGKEEGVEKWLLKWGGGSLSGTCSARSGAAGVCICAHAYALARPHACCTRSARARAHTYLFSLSPPFSQCLKTPSRIPLRPPSPLLSHMHSRQATNCHRPRSLLAQVSVPQCPPRQVPLHTFPRFHLLRPAWSWYR